MSRCPFTRMEIFSRWINEIPFGAIHAAMLYQDCLLFSDVRLYLTLLHRPVSVSLFNGVRLFCVCHYAVVVR